MKKLKAPPPPTKPVEPSLQERVEADKKRRAEEFLAAYNRESKRLGARFVPVLTVDGTGQVTGGFRVEVD